MVFFTYYASKWLEARVTKTNDFKVVVDFVKTNTFTRFGTPRAVTSDRGTIPLVQFLQM